MRERGRKGDLEMDGKGDVSSVDPPSILPSILLMAVAAVSPSAASLMIDLKGDEKTPHLHLALSPPPPPPSSSSSERARYLYL